MTKDQIAAIAFADAYMLDVGLATYTQLLEGINLLTAAPYGPERSLNYEALTRPAKPNGVRCHGDACCGGQLPCPTPSACGVAS